MNVFSYKGKPSEVGWGHSAWKQGALFLPLRCPSCVHNLKLLLGYFLSPQIPVSVLIDFTFLWLTFRGFCKALHLLSQKLWFIEQLPKHLSTVIHFSSTWEEPKLVHSSLERCVPLTAQCASNLAWRLALLRKTVLGNRAWECLWKLLEPDVLNMSALLAQLG